jgi:hypothetical protein
MIPARHEQVLGVGVFIAVSSLLVLATRKFGNELSLWVGDNLCISFGGCRVVSPCLVSDFINATPKKDPDPLTEKMK